MRVIRMSCAFLGAALLVTVPAVARTVDVSNLTQLTNALYSAAAGDEIVLAKGTYDLTDLAVKGILMRQATTSSSDYGQYGTILWLSKANMTLRGATGKPQDVTIKVDSSKNPGYRVLATSKNSMVRDLSITGGNASAAHCGGWNYRCGGAVSMQSDGIVVSNCVFYGNKSSRHGGAVSGLNGKAGTVIDCVFYGNNGQCENDGGGIAAGYSTFVNCVFTNNQTSAAATSYNVGVVNLSTLTNCLIAYNTTLDGALRSCVATDCRVIGNYAKSSSWNNCGGAGAKESTCTKCCFYGNTGYRLGGAVCGGKLYDCTIVSNSLWRSDCYGYGAGVYGASEVVGCTIVSNYAGACAGGGVAECSFVSNCVIRYNAARTGDAANPNNGGGGGAYNSTCYDSEFVGNLTVYGLGGGAMCGGSAYNCTFRDHTAGGFYNVKNLEYCDIESSGGIRVSNMVNCAVYNCDNRTNAVRAVNNVAYPNGRDMNQYMYLVSHSTLLRNCLFANNVHVSLPGAQVNSAMLSYEGKTNASRVENCTIADSVHYLLIRHTGSGVNFVNCALVRNRTGLKETDYNDTPLMDTSASGIVSFDTCAYTKLNKNTYLTVTNCVQIADPKFVETGDHPYTPQNTSPLVKNHGVILDWMTAYSVDLAGNPRLRGDEVDIGAYQCWDSTRGMIIIYR